jgi:hypothetical protein
MATKKIKKLSPSDSGTSREKTGSKWHGQPPEDKQFSSTNQPNKQNQLKAIREFHATRSMINEIFKMKFKWSESTEKIKNEIESAFGSEVANSNVFTIMVCVQVIKAINKRDTIAFEKLSNQCWGLPVIQVDTPHKMVVQVMHDDHELKEGLNSGYFPVN